MNRLDLLWGLQQVDLELAAKGRQLRDAQSQLGESAELIAMRQTVQSMSEHLRQLQSHVRDWELELDSLDSKMAQGQERLYSGRVTNPKELSSQQQDLEYLGRRRSELEDQILEGMGQVDEDQTALSDAREHLEAIETASAARQQELQALIQALNARVADLQAKRAELTAMIAESDLVTYDEIRRRKGGQALSIIQGDYCETCRVEIPSAKQQHLRHKTDLVLCEGCGRILYIH